VNNVPNLSLFTLWAVADDMSNAIVVTTEDLTFAVTKEAR
jgi:hypothetical protein